MTVLKRPSWIRDPEPGRRVAGWFFEVGIKAYGAAAALSVALSDAETVGGKADDALRAVPNLMDRYRDAKYVIEHRAEIQTALDYVNDNALDPDELEATAQRSTETLGSIETTYNEVIEARETLGLDPRTIPDALGHLKQAWDAKPDLGSIDKLAEVAESAIPFVNQVEILIPALYGGILTVADNFASDEIGATLAVMGTALAIAFILARAVGFWARRGRPGFISRLLQSAGARVYPGWYVDNLEVALGDPLYAAARKRTQDDIVADPQRALDPEAFAELEAYFERRRTGTPS
jgi:hypothetical protein